jgi:hypothetical protein
MTWDSSHLYKDWFANIGRHFPKEFCEFVKENWWKSNEDMPTRYEYRKKLEEIIEKYDKERKTIQEVARSYLKDD